MNILFLSYDNQARSQIAEGFYNYFRHCRVSKSAGFSDAITKREPLEQRILDCMAEKDINLETLTSNSTKLYQPHHAKEVRLIVCLSSYTELKTDAEKARWASAHEHNHQDWNIPVATKDTLNSVRDEIKNLVHELAR